jgi:hypothetical protein
MQLYSVFLDNYAFNQNNQLTSAPNLIELLPLLGALTVSMGQIPNKNTSSMPNY